MLSPFRNFFHYTKSERNGTLVLLVILSLLLIVYFIVNFWPYSRTKIDDKTRAEIQTFVDGLSYDIQDEFKKADSLFVFNPNLIGVKEWQLLGFTEKQAKSIEAYKAKGKVFKCRDEVSKLYVVSKEKFQELLPYIDLPDCSSYPNKLPKKNIDYYLSQFCVVIFLGDSIAPMYNSFSEFDTIYYNKFQGKYAYYLKGFGAKQEAENKLKELSYPKAKVLEVTFCDKLYPIVKKKEGPVSITSVKKPVNINEIDSLELISVKGIGPVTASRILKYRKILGGYLSISQLKEVYGITDEWYAKFKGEFFCNAEDIFKININTASIDEMKKHPYIDYKVANSIYWMRQNHGSFKNIEDIMKSDLINEELFSKIAPYLSIE
jgi:DNA uptake protein ComE-like DNA-binding protein